MTQTTADKRGMATGDGAGGGKRNWTRLLLIASVTLNLLVAGVVVGGIIGHDRRPPRPVVGDVSLGPFTDALTKEDRAALVRAAQTEGRNLRDMRKRASEEMREVIAALEADNFDKVKVQEMLQSFRTRSMERFALGERLMVDRLSEMTPEARKAFAARLREQTERFERGGHPPPPPQE